MFAWLRTVAVREGYRLARLDARRRVPTHQRQDLQTGVTDTASLDIDDFPGPVDLERTVAAREALAAVARLPARQRQYTTPRLAGHSYQEIAGLNGRTYTKVRRNGR